jgi:hypothetical protein
MASEKRPAQRVLNAIANERWAILPESLQTIVDIASREHVPVFALLEKVHSMPRQGVRSTFAFGKNYGFVTGLLTAFRIPLTLMTPQEWQKKIKQSNKKMKGPELKKFLKGIAQRLYPEGITITNDVADALLIAHVCREHYQE